MVNIENVVYTQIVDALRLHFPDISTSGEHVQYPAKFPHVSIVMNDRATNILHMDTSDEEKFVNVNFEVNVYSNKSTGSKSECYKIMEVINSTFYKMNFTNTFNNPVPNMNSSTISRRVARFMATTDGKYFYRRIY